MALKIDKTKLVKNLAAKYKLVPYIDRAIAEGEFPWEYKFEEKKRDDAWHPSGHCTPSLNELYHAALNPEERDFPASLLKTFQVGQFWHQYLQWIVEKKLEFCGPEDIERRGLKGWGDHSMLLLAPPVRAYKPFHWATGSGDIAPCDIPGHGKYVVDFKTMGSHDFKPNKMPAWCTDKYECQINIYMDFFDLDRGLIVAILKDSPHDMKEFEYERNQPLIDAIYNKWQLVGKCLEEGVEPPVDEEHPLPLKGPV